jgi:hypothetical protein
MLNPRSFNSLLELQYWIQIVIRQRLAVASFKIVTVCHKKIDISCLNHIHTKPS